MTDFSQNIQEHQDEVSKIIVGQEDLKRDIIVALLAG